MNQQLTDIEEMIKAFLTFETQQMVSRLFQLNKQALFPISKELPLYLCLVDNDTVNFEFVNQILSPIFNDKFDSSLGRVVRQGTLVKFYKVFGYYNRNLELTVLNEFEPQFNDLKVKGLVDANLKTKKMPLLDSAMIGALSMETALQAKKFRDSKVTSNGIELDLLMTYDNEYIQAFLDDKYGVQDAICAYLRVEGDDDDLNLMPTMEHKSRFDRLYQSRLLTAYNAV